MRSRPTCSWMTHDRFASSIGMIRILPNRSAFSLLEVIIALAILAGSAVALFSLLNMGSKFGQSAQQRTVALATANSILEELIATNRLDPSTTELTGVAGLSDPLGYRVRIGSYRQPSRNSEDAVGLLHVTVELFPSEVGLSGTDQRPICTLSRVVRAGGKNDKTVPRRDTSPEVESQ